MLPVWITDYPCLHLLLITFLPYIELRGSIPVGVVGMGMDPLWVFSVCTLANILIIFPIFLFLDFAFDRVFQIPWFHKHVEGRVESIRRSARSKIERFGFLGLAIFVAIPLPGTGAYSGCLASYLLDMERKRSILAIALGVLVAGMLVTSASAGAFSALRTLGLGMVGSPVVLAIIVLSALGFLIWRSRRTRSL